MAVTHNAAVTLASLQISISAEEIHNLGLDRMRKQRMRSIPQDFGELIGKCSWLNQLRDGIVRHGISLLQWRSGGVKHPHDMPPYRFTPSPTFAHSSGSTGQAPKVCAGPSYRELPLNVDLVLDRQIHDPVRGSAGRLATSVPINLR